MSTAPAAPRHFPRGRCRARLDDPMVAFKQGSAHRTNVLACSGRTTQLLVARVAVAP